MWTMLLACLWSPTALAGDLWLTVEAKDPDGALVLRLPANEIEDGSEPMWVETDRGRFDLREEARDLRSSRPGARRTFTVPEDDAVITLSHEDAEGKPATQVALELGGPLGNGLTLTFPLQADALGDAKAAVADADLPLDGLELDDATIEQLRRAPPTTILELTAADGGRVVIATR